MSGSDYGIVFGNDLVGKVCNLWRSAIRFYLVQENDMTSNKSDLILVGPQKQVFIERLAPVFDIHPINEAKDRDAFFAGIAGRVRAIAVTYSSEKVNAEFMSRLPKLEIVSSFGVGYDHVDAKWAGAHGIIVTNTPDVLNEEVADTALGLLLCTVREFPQAERFLRAGNWEKRPYPLTPA